MPPDYNAPWRPGWRISRGGIAMTLARQGPTLIHERAHASGLTVEQLLIAAWVFGIDLEIKLLQADTPTPQKE